MERTDEYPLDLQIGMSRVVSGKQQGLRQDSGGEGRGGDKPGQTELQRVEETAVEECERERHG